MPHHNISFFRILILYNGFVLKKYIDIFSAFSETECQTGFLMLENTCIQYFPDAGLRISDRSQKFCLVNGGGLAKDNIDNDKYNGGNFSDICSLEIINIYMYVSIYIQIYIS